VIGVRPGIGIGDPPVGSATRTVNPTGGVIGQPGPGRGGGAGALGRATSGRGTGPQAGPGAIGVGARGQRRSEAEPAQRWDPDNPWETDEGVPPVVLPPPEPGRHDPGPAIGSGR
jgi:hypothetical protein